MAIGRWSRTGKLSEEENGKRRLRKEQKIKERKDIGNSANVFL